MSGLVDLPVARRDAGLLRGIGVWGLSASIVNTVIGVGVFTMPAILASQAGAAAPWCYVLCAAVMACVTLCFAAAGSRVPTSGGAYGTVEAAFGPAAGCVVGLTLLISNLLSSGGVADAIADLLGQQAPWFATAGGRFAVIVCIYLLLAGVNLVGVRNTARVITAVTVVKLAPLVLFLVVAAAAATHAPLASAASAPPVTGAGFGRAMILTLFAFTGMETALGASGEVRMPARTLPRALLMAMVFVLALYLGVQFGAQRLLGAALAASNAPLADAMAQVSRSGQVVLLLGSGLCMLAFMASDVLGSSRMLFAMARDGRLPRVFGLLQSRLHIPALAVVTYALSAFVLALYGDFQELVLLSSLSCLAVYVMGCAAAVVLQRRDVVCAGPPLRFRFLLWAAVGGITGCLLIIAAASWMEIAGLLGFLLAGLLIYVVTAKQRPAALEQSSS